MGIFNRKSDRNPAPQMPEETAEQRRARLEATARRRAEREANAAREVKQRLTQAAAKLQKDEHNMAKRFGFPTTGARFVACDGVLTPKCLVVREAQVEFFSKETGALWQSTNQQHLAIPMLEVGEVRVKKSSSVKATLSVSGPTGGFELQMHPMVADYGAEILAELRAAAAAASAAGSSAEAAGGVRDGGSGAQSPMAALKELAAMREAGLIDEGEFAAKKASILERM